MRFNVRVAAFAVAAFCASAEAQSPILRGVVLDSASREPVSGAVITVLDASGQASSHAIAGVDGAFRMARPTSAAVLRVRRIGFRPREIPVSASDSAAIEIAMGRIPQVLTLVRVVGESHCPGSKGNSEAAQLWAQARDGLLAAIVARDAKPADIQTLTYARSYTPREEQLLHHRHQVRAGRSTRAFQAPESAARFAERGYVHEDATGRTFNAPDADVLLDESFAATHCFKLIAGSGARSAQIGLAFEPARSRRGIADVQGTLWMDRAKPALRTLEFRYTELDRLTMAAGAGGTIEFNTMENGVVAITSWSLRMPVLATRRVSSAPAGSMTRRITSDVSVAEISESGGLVISASWPDGVRWTQPIGALVGTVVEKGSRRPLANALVTFVGAWDTVRTDSAGRFTLTTVLAGRYDVVAIDTAFTPHVEARRLHRAMELERRPTTGVTFELPPREESMWALCTGGSLRAQTSVLLGRIRGLPRGAPGGLEVRVDWQAEYVVSGGSVGVREAHRTIEPDSTGHFHVCGVVRERPISISVRHQGVLLADTSVTLYDSLVHRVNVRIGSQSVRSPAPQPTATLMGTVVRDADSAVVGGAHVVIAQLHREAVADASGAFRIEGLAPGRYGVDVRGVGYAPRTDTISLAAGQTTTTRFVLARLAQLDTVTVAESRTPVSPALRGFEERRKLGSGGRFVDETELRKHDARTLGTVIVMRIPGLRAVSTPRGVFLASLRSNSAASGRAFDPGAPGTCWVTVYRDGSLIYDGTMVGATPPDFGRLQAQDYAAVEFYQVASTPPEFRGTSTGCGTLLLWSRERT